MLNFLICADAQPKIGTGHLRRMMTLAKALSDNGNVRISLQTSALGADIARGFQGNLVIAECTPKAVVQTLSTRKFDAAILDNYHWNAEATGQLRSKVPTIFVVDDLADRRHDADLLLDQNAHHSENDYANLVSNECKLLVGAKYCLLSEKFQSERVRSNDPLTKPETAPVFLSLGGGDPNNDLATMLCCIMEHTDLNTTIATGSHIAQAAKLRDLSKQYEARVELVFDSTRVVEQMLASQFAVAAGGTMTWERAVVGLPSLCLVLADNQAESSRWLGDRNVHEVFDARNGNWSKLEFIRAIQKLTHDRDRRALYSNNSKALISGDGAVRTAQALISHVKSNRH